MATSALNLSIKVKKLFFDRQPVMDMMDKKTLKALRWSGGKVRLTASRSIRDKPYGKSAPAGSPPYSHVTHAIAKESRRRKKAGQQGVKAAGVGRGLKYIVFAMEPERQAVVIGPVKFNGGKAGHTVPELQEFGGTIRTKVQGVQRAGRDKSGRFQKDVVLFGQERSAVVAPHPFMRPALEKISKDLPQRWAASVSGA